MKLKLQIKNSNFQQNKNINNQLPTFNSTEPEQLNIMC